MEWYVDIYETQHFRLTGQKFIWEEIEYPQFNLLPIIEEWLDFYCENRWSLSTSAVLSTKPWATVYFTNEEDAVHFRLTWFN